MAIGREDHRVDDRFSDGGDIPRTGRRGGRPALYCQYSLGWVLEMFETVLQKPVRVQLVQSIKSGTSSCVFRVEPAPKR